MTMKELKQMGGRLRLARKEKHLTQEQLAERVDKTAAYIGMLERGERIWALETFMDILEALEVTADYILCDSVSYGYKVYLGKYADQIDRLPRKEREKLIRIIAAFLD